ncbi:hypothetical protein [Halomonas sp. hl-4]|uniref:hypothetical protein n=1 Tax=Halomonas sp. hl-4 TaxID=1761789 RepID=UPI0018D53EB4|nr:hypothetical protein [Halomonas sp. hl-4]
MFGVGDPYPWWLVELYNRFGKADWLDDAFSAGDILMVQVLRRLNGLGLRNEYPNLPAYAARGYLPKQLTRREASAERHFEKNAPGANHPAA